MSFNLNLFLAVNEVAGDANVVGLALFDGIDDGAEGEIFDEIAVVEVGNQEKLERSFEALAIGAVTGKIEGFHGYIIVHLDKIRRLC